MCEAARRFTEVDFGKMKKIFRKVSMKIELRADNNSLGYPTDFLGFFARGHRNCLTHYPLVLVYSIVYNSPELMYVQCRNK